MIIWLISWANTLWWPSQCEERLHHAGAGWRLMLGWNLWNRGLRLHRDGHWETVCSLHKHWSEVHAIFESPNTGSTPPTLHTDGQLILRVGFLLACRLEEEYIDENDDNDFLVRLLTELFIHATQYIVQYRSVYCLHSWTEFSHNHNVLQQVRLGYCFTPYQRRWLFNGAPLVAFYDTLGIRRTYSRLKPPASSRGYCNKTAVFLPHRHLNHP